MCFLIVSGEGSILSPVIPPVGLLDWTSDALEWAVGVHRSVSNEIGIPNSGHIEHDNAPGYYSRYSRTASPVLSKPGKPHDHGVWIGTHTCRHT